MLRKQTAPSLSGPDCPAALIPAIRPLLSVSLGHLVMTRGDPRPSACMPVRQPRETTRSVWKWLCGRGGRRARPGDLASGQVLSRKLNPSHSGRRPDVHQLHVQGEKRALVRGVCDYRAAKAPSKVDFTDHSDLAEGRHVILSVFSRSRYEKA